MTSRLKMKEKRKKTEQHTPYFRLIGNDFNHFFPVKQLTDHTFIAYRRITYNPYTNDDIFPPPRESVNSYFWPLI